MLRVTVDGCFETEKAEKLRTVVERLLQASGLVPNAPPTREESTADLVRELRGENIIVELYP